MTASVDGFIESFPEFASRPIQELAGKLAAIELRIDADWGTGRDEVVYLELADTLTAGVKGRNARTERGKGGETRYAKKLKELQAMNAIGRRIA